MANKNFKIATGWNDEEVKFWTGNVVTIRIGQWLFSILRFYKVKFEKHSRLVSQQHELVLICPSSIIHWKEYRISLKEQSPLQ